MRRPCELGTDLVKKQRSRGGWRGDINRTRGKSRVRRAREILGRNRYSLVLPSAPSHLPFAQANYPEQCGVIKRNAFQINCRFPTETWRITLPKNPWYSESWARSSSDNSTKRKSEKKIRRKRKKQYHRENQLIIASPRITPTFHSRCFTWNALNSIPRLNSTSRKKKNSLVQL